MIELLINVAIFSSTGLAPCTGIDDILSLSLERITFGNSGEERWKDLAIETRRLEFEFFRKMWVYTQVLRAAAGDNNIIITKWIDTDKGDTENPNDLLDVSGACGNHTHDDLKPARL